MKSIRKKTTGLVLILAILTGSPRNQAGLVFAAETSPPSPAPASVDTRPEPLVEDCPDLLLPWPKRVLRRTGGWMMSYGREVGRTRLGRIFMVREKFWPAEAAWGLLVARARRPKFYAHPISWTAQLLSHRMRENNYHVSFTNLLLDRPTRCLMSRCFGVPFRWTIPMHIVMVGGAFVVGWTVLWSQVNRRAIEKDVRKHLAEDYRFTDLRSSSSNAPGVSQESLGRYLELRTFYAEEEKLRGLEGFGMPPDYEEVARFYRAVEAKKLDAGFTEADFEWVLAESQRTLTQPGSRHLLARLQLLQHPLLAATAELISNTNRYPAEKFFGAPEANRALSFQKAADLEVIDAMVGLDELRHWRWMLVEKIDGSPDGDPLQVSGLPPSPENEMMIDDLVGQPIPKLLEVLVRRGKLTRAQKISFWMEDIDNEIWFARMELFRVGPRSPNPASTPSPLQRRDFQLDLLTDVSRASGVQLTELTNLLDDLSGVKLR